MFKNTKRIKKLEEKIKTLETQLEEKIKTLETQIDILKFTGEFDNIKAEVYYGQTGVVRYCIDPFIRYGVKYVYGNRICYVNVVTILPNIENRNTILEVLKNNNREIITKYGNEYYLIHKESEKVIKIPEPAEFAKKEETKEEKNNESRD